MLDDFLDPLPHHLEHRSRVERIRLSKKVPRSVLSIEREQLRRAVEAAESAVFKIG